MAFQHHHLGTKDAPCCCSGHKSFSPLRGQSKTVRPHTHTHTHTHTHILYIHTTEYTLYGVLYDIDIDILIFPI